MSDPQFVIKKRNSDFECICQSLSYDQQLSSPEKLILYVGEARELKLAESRDPILFTRVGKERGGIYERFRDNIWYKTTKYSFEKGKLSVQGYKEYRNIWEWLEKRINPLAVMIATVVSALVTFAGINLNALITGNKQEAKILELEKQINILQKSLKEITAQPKK